jgi:hypothetical protein
MNEAQTTDLIDRIVLILSIQLLVAPCQARDVTTIEQQEGAINRKAIGYVYGFIDSALQARNEDITDLDKGLPILYHVLRNLFPSREQAYIDFLMLNMDDQSTVLGLLAGGQEYNNFIRDGKEPFGLAKFIFEGRSTSK